MISQTVSLPIIPENTEEEIKTVSDHFREAAKHFKAQLVISTTETKMDLTVSGEGPEVISFLLYLNGVTREAFGAKK